MRILFIFFLAAFLFSCKSNSSTTGGMKNEEEPVATEVPPAAMPSPGEEGGDLPSPAFLQKKFTEGIDFYARGNEPSWGLDMDFDKMFRFTSMTELASLSTPPVEANQAQDANILRYAAETEAGSMVITIYEEACTDNMSGEKFPFKVHVEAKNSADADLTRFEGCGRYVPDFRLNDIFVLEKLAEEAVAADAFGKGLPQLEMNLSEGKVIGHTGCNNLNGSVSAAAGRITFGPLATTRMACPGDQEQRLLKALELTRFYTFENLKLTLKDGGKQELAVFKKVD